MKNTPAYRAILVILLTNCIVDQGLTQTYNFTFEHYGKSAGLNQSSVNTLYQDSNDILWIGTFGGVNSFDGYEFKSFIYDAQDSTSISDDAVWTIYEDSGRRLWFGTKNGISLFDRKNESFKNYSPKKLSRSLAIKAILELKPGELIVGSEGEGAFIWNEETDKFTQLDYLRTDIKIISLQKTENYVWVGTEANGLYKVDLQGRTSSKVIPSDEFSLNTIQAMAVDQTGTLWIGSDDDGLLFMNENELKRSSDFYSDYQSGSTIRSIEVDDDDNIWVGSATNGLSILNKTEKSFSNYDNNPGDPRTLSERDISDIHIGSNEVNYIGFNMRGFDKVVKTPFYRVRNDPSRDNSLSANNIYHIYRDAKDDVWFSSFGGGLNKLVDLSSATFQSYRHNPDDPTSISHDWVRICLEDSKGNFWVGTWGGGLNLMSREKGNFKRYQHKPGDDSSLSMNIVTSLFEDSTGKIYIGTYGAGINIYNPETDDFIQIKHDPDDENSLSDDHITSFYEDSQGVIWVSTYGGGLNRWNKETGTWTRYLTDPENTKSLNDLKVLHLFPGHTSDYYWLTTLGGGLNKFFHETGEFIHYTTKDGLPNNATLGILKQDDHKLWISTNNGLSLFDPIEDTFENFTSMNGPSGEDFNLGAFLKYEDLLFFGSKEGVTYFDPNQVGKSSTFPKLTITSIKIDNQETNINESIRYNFDQRFTIKFAAVNPKNSQKIQYAYKFDDDPEWQNLNSERTLDFLSLEHGNHTLILRSTNSDKIWNDDFLELYIEVKPPWYRTLLFRLLASFILVLSGVFIYLRRVNNLTEQKRLLEQSVRDRTKVIADQHQDLEKAYADQKQLEKFKESLVQMIAHDLKNPLVTIIGKSRTLSDPTVERSGRRMLTLIENMLEIQKFESSQVELNLKKFDLHKVVQEVLNDLQPIVDDRKIQLINSVAPGLKTNADRFMIERVVLNICSNAIKFSSNGSSINIRTVINDEKIILSVEDHGPGIEESQIDNIFQPYIQGEKRDLGVSKSTGLGLTFCKLAIEAHHEKIWVNSEPGKGSIFSFSLPLAEVGEIDETTQPLVLEQKFCFDNEHLEIWSKTFPTIKKLGIHKTGEWMELIDELNKKGINDPSDYLMDLVLRHDKKGLDAFIIDLEEFVTTTKNEA